MDEWAFLDEVDVLAKWPADQKKFVFDGGKWSERKAAIEALNQLIEQNPRLSTASMTIYGELMDEIRKILDRESNIVVVTVTVRTVELLAQGLRNRFAGFIGMVLPFLIKRAKDKKKNVRDAILAAVIAVSDTTTPDRLQKDIIDWFGIPSPESKQTLLAFLYQFFIRQDQPDIAFIKAVAPLITKSASESDVTVRDKACQALGSLRRLMGDAISAFITAISTDNAKMEKIGQYEKEATEEWMKRAADKPKKDSGDGQADSGGSEDVPEDSGASGAPKAQVLDPWQLMDAEDIGKKIDKGAEAQLADKNWKERVLGGEAVKKELDSVGRVEISDRTREICYQLIKIIEKDVNVNVAALSAQCLMGLAVKARFGFGGIANRAFPVAFDKLKDKKAVLRDALNELCDKAAFTTPLSAYTESISTALTSKNPQTRQQTALFLSRFFSKNDQSTIEIDAVKLLSDVITKTTNDADKDVREAAIRVVAAVQKALGENIAKRLMTEVYDDKMKSDKIPAIIEELEKEFGKSASPEVERLAKHYKIGSFAASSTQSATAKRPSTSKPTGTARPIQSASGTVRKAPVAPIRRAPSPVVRAPAPAAPAPAPPRPRPFVARPAPNFAANKPKIAVKPVVKAPPVVATTSRPSSRGPVPRPSTSSTTSRVSSARPAVPIAPNVVRNGPIPVPARPIGVARPQTAVGAPTSGLPRTSRISAPTTGIVRPTSSGLPRPQSSTRLRPLSRPGSRNENH